MSKEQINQVQDIVNEEIEKNLPVTMEVTDIETANKEGATALIGEKSESKVKVYTIGNSKEDFFSKEVCGGPHVDRTGLLGKFTIQKEQSSSAGVRRIRAILTP
jgi:alanyl-tRNA synthetase